MPIPWRVPLKALSTGQGTPSCPFSAYARWRSNGGALPGGFTADGLREWALHTDFGADRGDALTGRESRRRRRQITEDPPKLPYVDLLSRRVTGECRDRLAGSPSPVDALGRAFFGSRQFAGERLLLSSLNSLLSLYPAGATTLPTRFDMNRQYLQWTVAAKAPLELICSYEVGGARFRGCTMLAFDPSLRMVYHGNVIDVAEEKTRGLLLRLGIKLHLQYAAFLLDGMVDELEKNPCQKY